MKKTFLLMLVCVLCANAWAVVELVDPNYALELYTKYDPTEVGTSGRMAVGPEGNIYITHLFGSPDYNGFIVKIDTEGDPSLFVDGLTRPVGIIWAGGTDFGDYLYITEGYRNNFFYKGGVTRIGLDGTITRFTGWSNGLNQPVCLGIDRTGNYGGSIFVGNSAADDIDRVNIEGTVTAFSPFPYNINGGSPSGIAFDGTGNYDGAMFVASRSGYDVQWEGLYRFDADGNPSKFVPDFVEAISLAFDVSEDSALGGVLYATARKADTPKLNLFSVNPDGTSKLIVYTNEGSPVIVSTPEGEIYMKVNSPGNTVTIYRITVKPICLAIWKLESAIDEKNAAIETIERAIAEEQSAIEKLDEIGDKDIHKAKMEILQAIQRQTHVKGELEKSIKTLQSALESLKN